MRWYENREQYVDSTAFPAAWIRSDKFALVHVTGDGSTTSGWGREAFMENYRNGKFKPEGYLRRFAHGRAFGFVMRALPVFCIDIDPKHGGLQSAKILELPPTTAETSRSGEGYHLFYTKPHAEWDERYGFEELGDSNGILPGIDIRYVGIVYHYPQQRWNRLAVAHAPDGIIKLMAARKRSQEISKELSRAQKNLDPEERAILADELLEELQKAIPEGRRNNTLFAWGCKADGIVKDWPLHLHHRGEQAGLDSSELVQIIRSVQKYGSSG